MDFSNYLAIYLFQWGRHAYGSRQHGSHCWAVACRRGENGQPVLVTGLASLKKLFVLVSPSIGNPWNLPGIERLFLFAVLYDHGRLRTTIFPIVRQSIIVHASGRFRVDKWSFKTVLRWGLEINDTRLALAPLQCTGRGDFNELWRARPGWFLIMFENLATSCKTHKRPHLPHGMARGENQELF